jgi:uncharacterized protein (UPF0548 family)
MSPPSIANGCANLHGVPRVTRPSAAVLAELLAEAKEATPTYREVGGTRHESLPAGYRCDRMQAVIGSGDETFRRAVEALRRWQAQIGAGIHVVPADAWVEDGKTVVLLIRAAGLWTTAPCRVVYVSEEADRFAFAYGTLPGHPERGEAAFALERSSSGEVTFRVWSFSRTVDPLARLGVPLTRRIQQRVTRRYLDALASAVSPAEWQARQRAS